MRVVICMGSSSNSWVSGVCVDRDGNRLQAGRGGRVSGCLYYLRKKEIPYKTACKGHRVLVASILWYLMIYHDLSRCHNKEHISIYISMIYCYVDTHHDAGRAHRYMSWCEGGHIDTYHDARGGASIYTMMRGWTHRCMSWCGLGHIDTYRDARYHEVEISKVSIHTGIFR